MIKLPTSNHASLEGEYLQGEIPSPITRISCRVRTLSPTICDGTCLDCNEQRNRYRELWVAKREKSWIGNNGGDPNEEMPDFDNLYKQHLAKITKAKNAIIEARKRLLSESIRTEKRVQERMAFLGIYASQQPINMPTTSQRLQ